MGEKSTNKNSLAKALVASIGIISISLVTYLTGNLLALWALLIIIPIVNMVE